MITGIDTILYNVKDFDRALGFYTKLIGEPTTLNRMDGGSGWAEFELADGTTFSIGKYPAYPWQAGYNIMFAVPDVPAASELVRSLGGTALEPTESPVCHTAMAEDTEGNQLILHQRKQD